MSHDPWFPCQRPPPQVLLKTVKRERTAGRGDTETTAHRYPNSQPTCTNRCSGTTQEFDKNGSYLQVSLCSISNTHGASEELADIHLSRLWGLAVYLLVVVLGHAKRSTEGRSSSHPCSNEMSVLVAIDPKTPCLTTRMGSMARMQDSAECSVSADIK
jgi:hypothetical protein